MSSCNENGLQIYRSWVTFLEPNHICIAQKIYWLHSWGSHLWILTAIIGPSFLLVMITMPLLRLHRPFTFSKKRLDYSYLTTNHESI